MIRRPLLGLKPGHAVEFIWIMKRYEARWKANIAVASDAFDEEPHRCSAWNHQHYAQREMSSGRPFTTFVLGPGTGSTAVRIYLGWAAIRCYALPREKILAAHNLDPIHWKTQTCSR